MNAYLRPKTIQEALEVLGQAAGKAVVLAGGTDLLPRWAAGTRPRPGCIVDLKHIPELGGISKTNGDVRIGTCATMTEIVASQLIRSTAPVLAEAAGRIACPQVRNRATIGGNLCNASPAADTAIPLLLLDAVVELRRLNGGPPKTSRGLQPARTSAQAEACGSRGVAVREVLLVDFFKGPSSTVLGPGELLTQIRFKPQGEKLFAAWDKFGTRPSMEIAVASVGLAIQVENRTVVSARVGYGSVAPIPLRGQKAEAELAGNKLSASVIAACVAAARGEVAPITDLRASEKYRREVIAAMLRRMLERAAQSNGG